MANSTAGVIGGVDTHKHTHHGAVIDSNGQLRSEREFSSDAEGHADLLAWMRSHCVLHGIGIEGTGCYGAALTRFLTASGVRVIEVNRPNRHPHTAGHPLQRGEVPHPGVFRPSRDRDRRAVTAS